MDILEQFWRIECLFIIFIMVSLKLCSLASYKKIRIIITTKPVFSNLWCLKILLEAASSHHVTKFSLNLRINKEKTNKYNSVLLKMRYLHRSI